MNFYELLAARVGTPEARALADSLSAWHDEMVLHRRNRPSAPCSADCPHHAAPFYWKEAQRVFGEHASELTFLRSLATPLRRIDVGTRRARREALAGPT